MPETEQSHQVIVDEAFPRMRASPRKTCGLDRIDRQAFAESRFNLTLNPLQVVKLFFQLCFRTSAHNDSGNVRDILALRMNQAVPFNQDLNVELEHLFERTDPLSAVYVRVWRGKVYAHEGIGNDEHFLVRIVKHDVVLAMSG